MRNLVLATSLLISACSLSSLAVALDVGGAVGGAVGAAGGAARGATGAVGGAVGAVGGAAGNAVGAVGGAAGSAVGAVGGATRGAVGTVGGVASGAVGTVGGIAGTASGAISGTSGRSVGTVGSTATSTGGLVGSFGAPATASRSLAAPSKGAASRQRWTLAPPRKINTLVYFPIESLYRRKPWQIRELLVRLDRDLLRTVRTSCRQVLAAPRSFTREHVQVCRIARAL